MKYILKEINGGSYVVADFAVRPAASVNLSSVNGYPIPVDRNEYELLSSLQAINDALGNVNTDYKTVRDAMKQLVLDIGVENPHGDLSPEQAGMRWLLLNDTGAAKIAATHNIGSGSQIVEAIPEFSERLDASSMYLTRMRASPKSVRGQRSIMVEAAFWAATKSVQPFMPVSPVSIPQLVLIDLAAATPANAGELTTSFLDLYEDKGLMGVADGDGTVGVLDYFLGTVGTRFEGANSFLGKYGSLTPAFTTGATMEDFRDYILSIFNDGNINTVVLL